MRAPWSLTAALPLLAQQTSVTATRGNTTVGNSTSTVRQEWRALSLSQRSKFISAIQCLHSLPANATYLYPGSRTRYDDYQGLHIYETDHVHFTGLFLPWHRYLLHLFESDLQTLCGWNVGIPYWGNGPYISNISNFTDILATEIPDWSGGGCITDGPFASIPINMGPGNTTAYNPHCLRRDFAPTLFSQTVNTSVVEETLAAEDYWHLNLVMEGFSLDLSGMRSHAGVQFGVGGMVGEMGDMYSSPADRLFWLHHSQLDRLWDQWQRLDWPERKYDIGGPDTIWAYRVPLFFDLMDTRGLLNATVSDFPDCHRPMTCHSNFFGDNPYTNKVMNEGNQSGPDLQLRWFIPPPVCTHHRSSGAPSPVEIWRS